MYIKMNDDECYVAKFNGVLKQNCYIVRKDYSFARKYDKCLQKIGEFCFQLLFQLNNKITHWNEKVAI